MCINSNELIIQEMYSSILIKYMRSWTGCFWSPLKLTPLSPISVRYHGEASQGPLLVRIFQVFFIWYLWPSIEKPNNILSWTNPVWIRAVEKHKQFSHKLEFVKSMFRVMLAYGDKSYFFKDARWEYSEMAQKSEEMKVQRKTIPVFCNFKKPGNRLTTYISMNFSKNGC